MGQTPKTPNIRKGVGLSDNLEFSEGGSLGWRMLIGGTHLLQTCLFHFCRFNFCRFHLICEKTKHTDELECILPENKNLVIKVLGSIWSKFRVNLNSLLQNTTCKAKTEVSQLQTNVKWFIFPSCMTSFYVFPLITSHDILNKYLLKRTHNVATPLTLHYILNWSLAYGMLLPVQTPR